MDWLHQNKITEDVIIYGDSNMVINQMSGVWKVRTKGKPKIYMSNHALAIQLRALLPNVRYRWIPREQNTEADALSTQPLCKRGLREPERISPQQRAARELDAAFERAIYSRD